MADKSTAIEALCFLTRSESRVRILSILLDEESATQRTFRESLSASRSTVTRALSALEEHGWIRNDQGSYRLTPSGQIIAEELTDLVDTVQATEELSTFIEWFPYADYDISLDQLRDTEITASTDPDPYAPSRKHAATLQNTAQFRALLPSIDLQILRNLDDRITAGELQLEALISPDMEETVSSGAFADLLGEQIATGNLTILVCEEQAPFYLGLSGSGTVQVGVEDDEGFPRAVLESHRDDLLEWGRELYHEYRVSAREKPVEDF